MTEVLSSALDWRTFSGSVVVSNNGCKVSDISQVPPEKVCSCVAYLGSCRISIWFTDGVVASNVIRDFIVNLCSFGTIGCDG